MADKVKGVRDFIGREAALRQEVLRKIRESYTLFGFEPIETPSFEYLSLFTDKSGPEIESQLYSFSDKKGEKLALRPEHTVSKLRAVSENRSLPKPFKVYSIGNVWRYEDTAKGRYREFTQADVDVYGSSSIMYDAEVIACVDFALKKLGIKDYKIHINSRKILTALIESLGIEITAGMQVLREIDKIEKVGVDEIYSRIKGAIGDEKAERVKSYLDGKYTLDSDGYRDIKDVMDYLKMYGVENAVVDNALVRGIDYYDGNIFEFISESKAYKGTIASGGRYDRLSEKFSVSMPIVGCSIGFDRVMDILMENPSDDFLNRYCVINIDNMEKAVEIAQRMRKKGVECDMFLEIAALSKGLDYCNSKRIRYAVIVGNKDLSEGKVTIRDLKERNDRKFPEAEI